MRYLFGFMCVLALAALPRAAIAQAGEEGATSEPSLPEAAPSSEPAVEEGGSRLERWHPEAFVDSEHEPSGSIEYKSPNASKGYSGEGIPPAGIGFFIMTGVTVVGAVVLGVGASRARSSSEDYSSIGVMGGGGIVMLVGGVGMIVTGVMWGKSTLKPSSSQKSRYQRERRAQWDLAQSQLVF
jgi:hypothetical protein